jgi:Anti-sigma factor NepR
LDRFRISTLTKGLKIEKFLKLQGLNSRGNVEHVMKDVKSPASKNAATGKSGGLNAEIQSRIGHQLRAMYDDVVRQGVPDRFAELIRKLDVPANSSQVEDTGGGTNNDGRD